MIFSYFGVHIFLLILHRMKVFFGAILLFILPMISFAQIEVNEETAKKLEHSEDYVKSDFDEEEVANYIEEKKLKFRAELGTFFGTGFGSNYYFGTYVSPHLSYRLTPRFTLSAGATLATSFTNTFNQPENTGYGYPGYYPPRSFVYAKGAYQVNDRLIISSTVYKEVNLFTNQDPAYNGFESDVKGIIMGVDYKLGDNVFIRGEIEISDGYRPYGGYPYSGNGFRPGNFNSFNDPF